MIGRTRYLKITKYKNSNKKIMVYEKISLMFMFIKKIMNIEKRNVFNLIF